MNGNVTASWPAGQTCSTRGHQFGWSHDGDPSTTDRVCDVGCAYEAFFDLESARVGYAPTGAVCVPGEDIPAPKPDTDLDGVPDDVDAFPNDPTESQDSDGDGIGDNADNAPNDPTNGDDKSEEGEPNGEKDNTATGGGTCDAPPICSGDGIQCYQAVQQWKLVCKGARVTGSPEVCGAAYTCTNDPAQCAQVALLRKTACDNITTPGGPGDADGNGIPDVVEQTVADVPGDEPGVGEDNGDGAWAQVDQGGWLGGSSCPGIPNLQLGGKVADISAIVCQQGATLGGFIYFMGVLFAAAIIGRSAAGG